MTTNEMNEITVRMSNVRAELTLIENILLREPTPDFLLDRLTELEKKVDSMISSPQTGMAYARDQPPA